MSNESESDDGQDLGLGFSVTPQRTLAGTLPARRPPKLENLKLSLVPSPSSPDLHGAFQLPPTPTQHTRSRTLPRSYLKNVDYATEPAPLSDEEVRKIQRWILCIAVVNFDVDVGPVLHHVYPNVQFSPQLRQNIAFSSFPDSASLVASPEGHSFRIRDPPTSPGSTRIASVDGFLYGYAIFLQKRDPLMRRGYLQKSVVILSHYPHVSLFLDAVTKLGPAYLKHGSPMLETACRDISSWPEPNPDIVLELGFLGSVVQVELPSAKYEQQSAETTLFNENFDPTQHILASVPSSLPIENFSPVLSSLWSLWECVILGEPLLVYSTHAKSCSDAVWWLRDLIRPIPLAADFRPFFTIHDLDFRALVTKNKPAAGLILGVTNPFFETACSHWPNILNLTEEETLSSSARRMHLGRTSRPASPSSRERTTSGRSQNSVFGSSSGWHSKHKRYISKDRALLKKLEHALRTETELAECSKLIRLHFVQQTEKLLVPLNRYFSSLIPNDISSPTNGHPPSVKPFNSIQFLASLKTHGSPLQFRLQGGGQREFYERFLKCSNFGSWLRTRVDLANEQMQKLAQRT